jgi:hypothetical protein
MGEKGKGAGAGLSALRKRRRGFRSGGGECHVEEKGGRGPGDRQRPGAVEADAGRAMHEQGRRGSGVMGPTWKREGAHGSRLEHVGRLRRKTGRARRNSVIFY